MTLVRSAFLPTAMMLLSAASLPHAQTTTAIRFARLWDGAKTIADAAVVIEGDMIASVGTGIAAVPKGAEIVDMRRYSAIPGLIDLHTHMT